MENDDKINQYDLVEIIQVPEKLKGVINIGDIGVVVAKYDDENVQNQLPAVNSRHHGRRVDWREESRSKKP